MAGSARISGFSSLGDRSWLQGRRLLPALRRHGDVLHGAVLDLGCGTSPFRPLFPHASAFLRVDRYPVDPSVIVADATRLPFEDGCLSAILLSQVIGDVDDLAALFRELARLLAPGGKILIYETMTYPQHDLPRDYWRVLPGGLNWLGGQVGLKSVEIEYLGGYFTQLSVHWNSFIVGNCGGLKPLSWIACAFGNLFFGALDGIHPRPHLASDYFACLEK